MAFNPLACREVHLHSLDIEEWREVDIGCVDNNSFGDFPDIDKQISGGGYAFKSCANRFLLYRCIGNTLELVELSTEYDLVDNAVRFKFPLPILPYSSGFSVYENVEGSIPYICILVATPVSIHRLLFPHPINLEQSTISDQTLSPSSRTQQSIFGENVFDLSDLQLSSHNHKVMTSTSPNEHGNSSLEPTSVCPVDDNTAVLGCTDGSLLMVSLPTLQEIHNDILSSAAEDYDFATNLELVEVKLTVASIMKRLWSGFIPSFASSIVQSGFGASNVLSVSVLPGGQVLKESGQAVHYEIDCDTYAFCVAQDHKLRIWNLMTQDCSLELDIMQYKVNFKEGENEVSGSRKSNSIEGQSVPDHRVAVHLEKDDPAKFSVVVYYSFEEHNEFLVFAGHRIASKEEQNTLANTLVGQGDVGGGNAPPSNWKVVDKSKQFELHFVGGKQCIESYLIDFAISDSMLWAIWARLEGSGKAVCTYSPLYSNVGTGSGLVNQWKPVFPAQDEDVDVIFSMDEERDNLLGENDEIMFSKQDPQEIFLNRIFLPGRFSFRVVCNALRRYKKDHSSSIMLGNPKTTLDELQSEVISTVQSSISENASGIEIDPDEYRSLVIGEWRKFYECIYHCFEHEQGTFLDSVDVTR